MEWTESLVLRLEESLRDIFVDMSSHHHPNRHWWGRWLEENEVMLVGPEDMTINWNRWPDHVLVRCPMDGYLTPERWLLLPDAFATKILALGFAS